MATETYLVRGMSCAHCLTAIEEEVAAVPGVTDVAAELETKRVRVSGEALEDAAVRAAILEAGYEAE